MWKPCRLILTDLPHLNDFRFMEIYQHPHNIRVSEAKFPRNPCFSPWHPPTPVFYIFHRRISAIHSEFMNWNGLKIQILRLSDFPEFSDYGLSLVAGSE